MHALSRVLLFATLILWSSASQGQARVYEIYEFGAGAQGTKIRQGVQSLLEVSRRLEPVSNVSPRLLISDSSAINAYATNRDGVDLIVFSAGILDLLADDRDATAFVFAHELAHLKSNHLRESFLRDTFLNSVARILIAAIEERTKGKLLAAVLGRVAVDLGTEAVSRKFSRGQELEADDLAVRLIARAGFEPEAAIRFHRVLLQENGIEKNDFFSTHPTFSDRIAAIEKLLTELSPPPRKESTQIAAASQRGSSVIIGSQMMAVSDLHDAAAKNRPDAQYILGLALINGNGMKQNQALGLEYLRRAAQNGVADAGAIQSMMDYSKLVGSADRRDAISDLNRSAVNGSLIAKFALGAITSTTADNADNAREALTHLGEARDGGVILADLYSGVILSKMPTLASTRGGPEALIRASADAGSQTAQVTYGVMLAFGGQGIEKDSAKAWNYFAIAGRNGAALAQLAAGVMRWEGIGVERAPEEAVRWLRLSAQQGNKAATIYLDSLDAYRAGDMKTFREIRERALSAFRVTAESETAALARNEAAILINTLLEKSASEAMKRLLLVRKN